MAQIPQHTDPTLEAMQKAVEDTQQFQNRDYLGASLIGDLCSRKIWYNINGFPRRKSGAIGLMAADSGYYAEDKTAERLRLVEGVELHTHMADGEQYGWEREIKLEYPRKVIDPKTGEVSYQEYGKIAGHYDGLIRGIIQAPKAIHIWEHKDKDHKKFADFQTKKNKFGEKDTLKEWDINYYGQAQINMHMARIDDVQIDRHYLTVSYAGGRKYDSCRTEYNPEDAERLYNKAIKILNADQPPVKLSEKSDFYLCRFCDYRKECHGKV